MLMPAVDSPPPCPRPLPRGCALLALLLAGCNLLLPYEGRPMQDTGAVAEHGPRPGDGPRKDALPLDRRLPEQGAPDARPPDGPPPGDGRVTTEGGRPTDTWAAADGSAGCGTATANYSPLIDWTVGCPGGVKSCAMWQNLCLRADRQYVVLSWDETGKTLETYGVCTAELSPPALHCFNGPGDVLHVSDTGPETLSGNDDFTGKWRLLQRDMSTSRVAGPRPGCAGNTCALFQGTEVDASPTSRHHLRRVWGTTVQWFSWCTAGSASTDDAVDCRGMDPGGSTWDVHLLRSADESASPGRQLSGQWTLYAVLQNKEMASVTGCGASPCELFNGFSLTALGPYSLVQTDGNSIHWFQLCSASRMGSGSDALRCYRLYNTGATPPYFSLLANDLDSNMNGYPMNATWHFQREPH